jgi:hypothetical protein
VTLWTWLANAEHAIERAFGLHPGPDLPDDGGAPPARPYAAPKPPPPAAASAPPPAQATPAGHDPIVGPAYSWLTRADLGWDAAARRALLDMQTSVGLDPKIGGILAVIDHESGGNPRALNPLPAAGLFQLTVGAHLPGFDSADKIRAVTTWAPAQQLHDVGLPLYQRMFPHGAGSSQSGAALLRWNFLPAVADWPADAVLGVKEGATGPGGETPDSTIGGLTRAAIYKSNSGFDPTGRGFFTWADIDRSADGAARRAAGRGWVRVSGAVQQGSDPAMAGGVTGMRTWDYMLVQGPPGAAGRPQQWATVVLRGIPDDQIAATDAALRAEYAGRAVDLQRKPSDGSPTIGLINMLDTDPQMMGAPGDPPMGAAKAGGRGGGGHGGGGGLRPSAGPPRRGTPRQFMGPIRPAPSQTSPPSTGGSGPPSMGTPATAPSPSVMTPTGGGGPAQMFSPSRPSGPSFMTPTGTPSPTPSVRPMTPTGGGGAPPAAPSATPSAPIAGVRPLAPVGAPSAPAPAGGAPPPSPTAPPPPTPAGRVPGPPVAGWPGGWGTSLVSRYPAGLSVAFPGWLWGGETEVVEVVGVAGWNYVLVDAAGRHLLARAVSDTAPVDARVRRDFAAVPGIRVYRNRGPERVVLIDNTVPRSAEEVVEVVEEEAPPKVEIDVLEDAPMAGGVVRGRSPHDPIAVNQRADEYAWIERTFGPPGEQTWQWMAECRVHQAGRDLDEIQIARDGRTEAYFFDRPEAIFDPPMWGTGSGEYDPPTWVWISLPGGYQAETMAEPVARGGVRVPMSFAQALDLASANGWLPPTRAIVDARLEQAANRAIALPVNDARGALAVGTTAGNAQAATFAQHLGPVGTVLREGGWKSMILDPDGTNPQGARGLAENGPGSMVFYGWLKPDGRSFYQGGHMSPHDNRWIEYDSLAAFTKRQGLGPDGQPVDLLDVITPGGPLGGPLPAWLDTRLRGGSSGGPLASLLSGLGGAS